MPLSCYRCSSFSLSPFPEPTLLSLSPDARGGVDEVLFPVPPHDKEVIRVVKLRKILFPPLLLRTPLFPSHVVPSTFLW